MSNRVTKLSAGQVVVVLLFSWCLVAALGPAALAQQNAPGTDSATTPPTDPDDGLEDAPGKVEVMPVATDDQIEERLLRILRATQWFESPEVRVDEGVVFLAGQAESERHREWAGNLARSTEDVVAVVNQMGVIEPPLLDFTPTFRGMNNLWRSFVRNLPWIVFALVVVAFSYVLARATRILLARFLNQRLQNALLTKMAAFAGGTAVFLLGLYFVLRVAGLTQLAITVLGGTGIIGIVLGIGFRDISENFLASLLLSWHHPFQTGDLIEVVGVVGYVERMTVRTTLLMTLDGNHVQIPNSTVYKNLILNFTSNPNRREDFVIGIDYNVEIPFAQEVAMQVLSRHVAVLAEPPPWVLVDNLGPATVNLRIYFWLDGREHSWLKVRSSVIRLVKRAFQEHGIGLPDEAREIVFPREVPIRLLQDEEVSPVRQPELQSRADTEAHATSSEGGLSSDADEIKQQSQVARAPEGGADLLADSEKA